MALIPNPNSEFLREPNLLIPGKKPVGSVKIDWGNPLAPRDLCLLFRSSVEELVHGDVLTTGNQLNLISNQIQSGEQVTYFDGNNNTPYYTLPHPVDHHVAGDIWSITWRGWKFASAHSNDGVFIGVQGTTNHRLWMRDDQFTIRAVAGNIGITTDWGNWTIPGWYTVVFTSSGCLLYKDGVLFDSNETSNEIASVQLANVAAPNDTAYSMNGYLSAVYVNDFGLSSQQIADLHNDPYQFLIPA